jgi:hypothetical protein
MNKSASICSVVVTENAASEMRNIENVGRRFNLLYPFHFLSKQSSLNNYSNLLTYHLSVQYQLAKPCADTKSIRTFGFWKHYESMETPMRKLSLHGNEQTSTSATFTVTNNKKSPKFQER